MVQASSPSSASSAPAVVELATRVSKVLRGQGHAWSLSRVASADGGAGSVGGTVRREWDCQRGDDADDDDGSCWRSSVSGDGIGVDCREQEGSKSRSIEPFLS